MTNKLFKSFIVIFFTVLCVLLAWEHATLLSFLLLLIAYIKHKIIPISKELLWFILVSVGGTFVEVLLVNIAHAWSYATPHFLGIPIYMPIFWGVVGITIIVLYDGLNKE